MQNLPNLIIEQHPFTHAIRENFLPEALYRDLAASFPTCPPTGGPTGFSYFRGDPAYDVLVARNAAWHTFVSGLQSQTFIDYCSKQFANACKVNHCLLELHSARYVDRYESRAEKAGRHLDPGPHKAEDLWVRADILQGRTGYVRAPHLDHRRRVLTLLIYFCDADEMGIQGGELILNARQACGDFTSERVIAPRHNLLVAFPCSASSYHSVSRIHRQRTPRNFVQITVSSCFDAWPTA